MITKPMLASAVEDVAKLQFPVLVSPKLDGIRCLLIDGKALTRSFKPVPNVAIQTWLEADLANMIGPNVALDGELHLAKGTEPFQAVSSAIMSEDGTPDFRYWVFDMVRFDTGGLTQPFADRYACLAHVVKRLPPWARRRVKLVEHAEVSSQEELDAYEARFLEQGYEGAMIRDPQGPYKLGRSTAKEGYLLKLKRFCDAEAVIIGFEERMHNANEATKDELGRTKRSSHKAGMVGAGTLGALLVKDAKTDVEFGIGTGFNDVQRRSIWKAQAALRGKLVRYKFQPTGVKEAPRFPVFISFRDARDL